MKPSWRDSLIGLAAIAFIAALVAFLLHVGQMPREPEFESDGWTSEAFKPNLAIGNPPYPGPGYEARAAERKAYAANLPDPFKTPGAVFKEATVEKLSKPGYSATVRDVSLSLRKQVFERYGIPWEKESLYECDHLVSLEIGGSNAIENLWPEPYAGEHGAREKDVYENWLHRQVDAGKIELRDAQKRIASDWYGNMKHDMPDYKPPSER